MHFEVITIEAWWEFNLKLTFCHPWDVLFFCCCQIPTEQEKKKNTLLTFTMTFVVWNVYHASILSKFSITSPACWRFRNFFVSILKRFHSTFIHTKKRTPLVVIRYIQKYMYTNTCTVSSPIRPCLNSLQFFFIFLGDVWIGTWPA